MNYQFITNAVDMISASRWTEPLIVVSFIGTGLYVFKLFCNAFYTPPGASKEDVLSKTIKFHPYKRAILYCLSIMMFLVAASLMYVLLLSSKFSFLAQVMWMLTVIFIGYLGIVFFKKAEHTISSDGTLHPKKRFQSFEYEPSSGDDDIHDYDVTGQVLNDPSEYVP